MLDHIYPDTLETTGNYLRLALKQIAKHKQPYNPISYALWYEYASSRNPQLNKDIEEFEKKDSIIPFDMILKWFRKYIADQQTLLAEKKTKEFQSILNEMTKHLGNSGDRLNDQGNRLEAYTSQLGKTASMEDVRNISQGIMSETKSIIKGSSALKQDMDETMSEIDALKKELEGFKEAAKTDMLTGLLNRRGFDEAVDSVIELSHEKDSPLTLIITDIDHFKKVNDTHGHLIGDNVLKMLAKLLKDHIKGKDIAARFGGGEEFILVLPETNLKGGFILSEQIRHSLQNMRWRTKNSGEPIGSITISLGVAQYKKGEDLNTLIERADNALYYAKENGRNKTITELDREAA
ncbi:MAG: GGDEF domain-containing protein [Desulfobacter sp.]|nr:GGDEF domain-containing protein [Desulfobacter sp.]